MLWILGLGGGVAALFVRWRSGEPVVRRQIGLLMFASAVLTLMLVVYNLVFDAPTTLLSEIIVNAAVAGLPLTITVAVLRYRLYDIDRIISRTVFYALIVGLLGLIVFGIVTGISLFLPSDDPLAAAIATLTAFARFNPLRRRIQALVDRRFNRAHYNAAAVIEEFTGSMQGRIDPRQVVSDWTAVIEETMQPRSIGVWTRHQREAGREPEAFGPA